MNRPLIVVLGPTASGKSALAVSLAEAVNGEVVSGDSMQVYRGMDIGTGKITAGEARGVPHHLVDIKDPREGFSVAEFQTLARSAIADIHQRGRIPILAGGTGLYIGAVVDPYEFGAQARASVTSYREGMRRLAAEKGNGCLHALLAEKDPVTAAKVHPNDIKRVIRALEFFEIQGRPISSNQGARGPGGGSSGVETGAKPLGGGSVGIGRSGDGALGAEPPGGESAEAGALGAGRLDGGSAEAGALGAGPFEGGSTAAGSPVAGPGPLYQTRFIGLRWEREQLYRRINGRVDTMIRKGWAEEVRLLLEAGVPEDAQSMQAIGYRHIVGFLNGQSPWDSCVEQIKMETRRFAKRQMTWFRRNPRIFWLDAGGAAGQRAGDFVRDILQDVLSDFAAVKNIRDRKD
ncbi:MAG: tRNA (adenosine(37)-N6)-dimethylallyltransferase MiaA [Peptococcaceae bacterium]|jgi:tRNA A37 N6-isopentenylltransferase MiaA|nr:tRNA (adenosine(37)-N6)-dimethylallyltransferase MiaA [Peptococcaceae bacterium]